MDDDEWTLEQWVKTEKEQIDSFAATWATQQKRYPDRYPAKLPPGEWDEQYRSWTGDADGEE